VHAPRRLSLLLASGLLALALTPAAPALGKGAGDAQGGELPAQSNGRGPARTKPPLTDRPHRPDEGSTGSRRSRSDSKPDTDRTRPPPRGETGGSDSSSKSSGASGATTTQLPNTGADARVVGLLGLALVLLGLGLRLRIADVRR